MPDTIKVIIESLPKESSSILNITNIFTIIIAIFVAFIGFRQWRLEKNKLRFELYEKRYAVFVLINSIVSNLRHKDDPFFIKITDDEIYNYLSKIDSYVFLFNNDVKDIIVKINKILKNYLRNHELELLLKRETIQEYYIKKKYLSEPDHEIIEILDNYKYLDYERQEEFLSIEFEKMEFNGTALDYISDIEKNYEILIEQIDKYINIKKIV